MFMYIDALIFIPCITLYHLVSYRGGKYQYIKHYLHVHFVIHACSCSYYIAQKFRNQQLCSLMKMSSIFFISSCHKQLTILAAAKSVICPVVFVHTALQQKVRVVSNICTNKIQMLFNLIFVQFNSKIRVSIPLQRHCCSVLGLKIQQKTKHWKRLKTPNCLCLTKRA